MSESDGRNSLASDERQKELSISLAASSMINASDMIPEEAYQANLKRIQEVKEMVKRLEMNNETAHKNYLVDQLEKRAKDGREAEIMLARLRDQPGLSETDNVPSEKPEVILPTTATLVEVTEPHPSHFSPGPTTVPLQTIQQGHPAKYQWSIPPQVQPYNSDAFRYYVPLSTARQPAQNSSMSRCPAVEGQIYTTQNVPSQSRPHNPLVHQTGFPIQVQQHSQPQSNYPPPVIALQGADTAHVPGYYTSPSGWIRTEPAYNALSTGSSSITHREPTLPMQSTASRPPVTPQAQLQSLSSLAPVSQVPLHGAPAPSTKIPSGQPPPTRSHPKPAEAQSWRVSTAVSNVEAISEFQRHHRFPQQSHHHRQQPQHQTPPQPLPQPRQRSLPPQPQPQRLLQPPLRSERHPQQCQELPSQRPIQPSLSRLQAPPQSTIRTASTSVTRLHSQPSHDPDSMPINASSGISQTHSPHLPVAQEQTWQQNVQPRADLAAFIRLFQTAVQRGVLQLKALFLQAKASGVSDEWFRAAISSLPRDVWESVVVQLNRSESALDAQSSASIAQEQVPRTPGLNVPATNVQPSSTATPLPLVQMTPATQQATKPNTSTEERITLSATGKASGAYAAQLHYYAEQATKSAYSAQVANISTTLPGNTPLKQQIVATPARDVPQVQTDVRTPKDANKSTLARDILRSFGKAMPKSCQELGRERTADHSEGNQLPEVASTQPISHMASPKPPEVLPATSFIHANPPLIPSAKPSVPDHLTSLDPSMANSVLKEQCEHATVIEGPIMIDLTLEDSDESVDGKGQEPEATFPIQTTACTATSPRPVLVSPASTTDHTPLLENLSLDEPSVDVDVTATGDNADVPMYSPLLSLPAEENMESELSHLPLRSTEPVPPSFKPVACEASEYLENGHLPLFLPSPPVSPARTEPPETEPEVTNDEGKTTPSYKRRSVGTDEIEIDTGTPAPRVRKRRKQRVYVLIPPAPLYVKKAIKMRERAMRKDIGSDTEGVGEDEEFQYSHLEQLLIEESKSLLFERRCRWLNCGVILNCAVNLLAHLKKHAHEEDSLAPFLCRWGNCRRRFDAEHERDLHLERHTIRPLPCPFAGCDERFNKPVEVMQHEVQHQKVETREPLMRKTTYQPIVPAIPARLGPPPYRLPSHRVIPRRIVKCQITADRHATMGPWILWNIFSPVELNTRKQNASMRSRPGRQVMDYDIDGPDPRRDDYDFLLALSSYPAKNPQLDDLDSTLITMSAARGLTLWGSGSATPEESTVLISAAEEARMEEKSNRREVAVTVRENSRTEERESGQSVAMGEEDDVEKMLIL